MSEKKVMMEKKDGDRLQFHRRALLLGTACLTFGLSKAHATIIVDKLPWTPNAGNPPTAAAPGYWMFFTSEEGRAVEALADRIIPPDRHTPGGKESGSAVFIDRQLAGPYGRQDGLYVRPPFMKARRARVVSPRLGRAKNIVKASRLSTGHARQSPAAWHSPIYRIRTRIQS
jgi:gluconate 2-dehydrogenase gamma chain